jgi:serine/threonine-protein kinase
MPVRRDSTRPDPMIGVRVADRYRIEHVHERGGTSVIYAATHEAQQREVAIKMLDEESSADPQAVERFMLEAHTASSLSHGHVVGVSDFGQLPSGRPYLVMPMIMGKDLATLISEQGPLSAKRVAALLAGVASALDSMHAKGLVHRDIKSENLMYVRADDGTETALVLDFGIAATGRAGLRRTGAAGRVLDR